MRDSKTGFNRNRFAFLIIFMIQLLVGANTASSIAAAPTNPYTGQKKFIKKGRALFSNNCAHCHGHGAVTVIPERDLKGIDKRYGKEVNTIFYETVTKGRSPKGMPPWVVGVAEEARLTEKEIWSLKSYLETLQIK
ncbi:MAG: c-type cytochrome [Proteobacteria bacterium]|nr:c-type cytochrome [Pseudomonadota bacterium]